MTKEHYLNKRRQQELLPLVAFEITATSSRIKIFLPQVVSNTVTAPFGIGRLIQPIGPWLYFTFGQKSE